ncbi:bifunctional Protein kinase-like domain superfamily/Armadillo-like helical/Armadillo-type fold [Babesia duncani]|uniref:Bifunctional Protein kinase-like domain superfamily/Armadillo-like helical/Armadillo-type fold n=1 Tax=Babesia duncani TaxID=323732 RepID=A0AAD9PLD6_9APIC|nr:bifunctional Protein kinase-like domain superfamily/Armadillo-like helical/Armadillo-type fold [Babesia duncani]
MLKYLTSRSPIASIISGLGYTEVDPVAIPFGRIQSYNWFDAIDNSNESKASLFKFSTTSKDNNVVPDLFIEFANRHLKHIKLLRHPYILKVLKTKQSEKSTYIVTERCYPLTSATIPSDPTLGFHQIFSAVHFLHTKCNLINGLISPIGVVVREDGSWCLSWFELANEISTSIHRIINDIKWHVSWQDGWRPPVPNCSVGAEYLDRWGLGALMCWVYALLAGKIEKCNTRRHDFDIYALKVYAPKVAHDLIDQLLSPRSTVDIASILETHPYFTKNAVVSAVSFALELHIKSEEALAAFFKQLVSQMPQIPSDIACKQLLPEILKAINLYSKLVPQILECVMLICQSILIEDFKCKVYPHIAKLFQENDRFIRFTLLRLIPDLDRFLGVQEFSQDIFQHLLIGFNDVASQIRDETVKCMHVVIQKINSQQQHTALMCLLKSVEDREPTIRVNAIICIAKIIPHISSDAVSKFLPQVWKLGLGDTFTKCRISSLEAIMASLNYFKPLEKAQVLIPLVATTLLDTDQSVASKAFTAMDTILESIRPKELNNSQVNSINDAMEWNTSRNNSFNKTSHAQQQSMTASEENLDDLYDFFDSFPCKNTRIN